MLDLSMYDEFHESIYMVCLYALIYPSSIVNFSDVILRHVAINPSFTQIYICLGFLYWICKTLSAAATDVSFSSGCDSFCK